MTIPAGAAADGGGRTVAMVTLGCKVNTYESEQILQSLERDGKWCRAAPGQGSDLYVINSCTVTREADRQTRQAIRRCVRENPNAMVVVTGCYAQMDAAACGAIDGVDLVVGNDLKLKIPALIPRFEGGDLPRVVTAADADDLLGLPDPLLSGFESRSRAFVQIQQGCDQGCTFCIIHRARGASRSLPASGILQQAARLADAGFCEIVLCGVDLGAWGTDLGPDEGDLVSLLERLLSLPGDFRIRLGSLDPVHISDALTAMMTNEPRLCPHLHVSMQSADTLILKRMKRRYDRETLYRVVNTARERVPDLVVGADVMAGFPTEAPEHFLSTLNAITDLGVAFPHVFPYSERPGTPAARIPRQVPGPERARRAARLREAGKAVLSRTLGEWVGRDTVALAEGEGGTTTRARLSNYLPLVVEGAPGPSRRWAPVRITGHDGAVLHGERAK